MDHNSDAMMNEAMRLAQTSAGQQLLTILQQQNGADLQQIMNCAASGDYQKAMHQLSSLLDSPEAQALLKQLGR